jgi:hypothetical protein
MELFVQQQQGWGMNPYMPAGQNPYAYGGGGGGGGSGGGGGGGGGGANGNMQQNPYAYAQHPMMFSTAAVCKVGGRPVLSAQLALPHYCRTILPHAPPAPDRAQLRAASASLSQPRPASARLCQPARPPHHVAYAPFPPADMHQMGQMPYGMHMGQQTMQPMANWGR